MGTSSQSKPVHTWKPTVAGILSIVAGAVALLVGVGVTVKVELARRMLWHWRWDVAALLALVLGIIAVVGGIYALSRRIWGLALAGAICALFPPHVCVLGILAVIFVALSRGEFDQSRAKVGNGAAQPPRPPTP